MDPVSGSPLVPTKGTDGNMPYGVQAAKPLFFQFAARTCEGHILETVDT